MTLVRKAKSARGILLAACAAVLTTAAGASAATGTWNGGGNDDNWSTPANWLSGTAPLAGDSLLFDGSARLTPTNDFAAGTSFTGINFTPTAGAFTLGGNQITLSGDLNDDAAGMFETVNLGLALDANRTVRVTDGAVLTVNGAISGTGFGITKSGNGTLTLGANNTYTGATVIDGGVLAYLADNTAGAVNFGTAPTAATASANAGLLDLSSANLTAGSLLVQTNTGTANLITIGDGKTLTVNGGVTIGVGTVFSEANGGANTVLNVSGGGSLVVNGGASHFAVGVGRSNTTGIPDPDPVASLDMSGLQNFTYTGTTAELRVGGGNVAGTLSLGINNTITASAIRVADSGVSGTGNNNGGRSTLHLGAGTNVLNTNNLIIGETKGGGTLDFGPSAFGGTVRINGQAGGASTVNIQLGSASNGTGTGNESRLFLAGHDATVQAGNVVIGRLAGGGGTGASAHAQLTFDTGTLNANSIQLGVNSSGANTSGPVGIFTFGGPFAGSGATGVLNVTGQFYLANRTTTTATAGRSTGTFTLNGGTANIGTDILDASTTIQTVQGVVTPNLTTLTLDGGTLNMSGHNIGTYTAPITAINLNSGTLNGTKRISGITINVSPTVTINDAPTFLLPDAGTLNSSLQPLTLASGGGIEGGGTSTAVINGDVVADTGSHLAPGTATAQGSLLFSGNLTLNDGSTTKFKLSENATSGNDFVAANNLTLVGKVNLVIGALGLGPQSGNIYTLFNYTGTLAGDETNFNVLGDGSRSTFAVIPTTQTPGSIQLSVVAGSPHSLIWVGNNGDNWQAGPPSNWKDASDASPQQFFSSDQVSFDQSSTNLNPVQIPANVSPGSVRVSADRDYKFVGAGGIGGTGNLTKDGNGTLTLATNNTYSGSTDINAGTLRVGDGGTSGSTGTGAINVNSTLVFNRSNALAVANAINGNGSVVQSGAGVTTLSGANNFAGGLTINGGAVRATSAGSAGVGNVTVNSGALVSGANQTAPITLNNGAVLGVSGNSTFSGDVTVNGAGVTFRGADPTNLPTVAGDVNNLVITGSLLGSANINVLSNGQDNNPDGGNGVRLQQVNTTQGNYSGTITVANNVKFELQTAQAGPFSPAGTGKIVMTAGDASLGGALTTKTLTGGYSEINLRNNSSGDTVFGNDISVAGSGLVVLNPLGTAAIGTKTTMGKLTVGAGQEVGVYLSANPAHVIEFTSVSLNGTATFSPKKAGFGADSSVGSDLSLANISETTPSGINMNGLRTLFLTTGNSYTGPTTVNSGTLRVNNTAGSATGSGAVTVAGGATLSGSGIVGGAISAQANSHVAPGNAGIGSLTLGGLSLNNSILDFEGSANTFDLLNVTSNNGLTFNGNSTLNLTEVSSLTPGDYTLIDYVGSPVGNLSGKLALSNSLFGGGSLQGSLVDDAASTSIKLHLAPVAVGPAQWAVDADGSWTSPGSWNTGLVPDGANNGAAFLGAIASPRTVTLDGDRTIGSLAFDNANKYTITSGSGGTLRIGDDANAGSISVATGSHEISAPVTIDSTASVDVDAGAALKLSGGMSVAAGKSLTKTGDGTLRVSGPQAHGVGAALTHTQGTLQLDSNAGTPNSAAGSNLSLTVAANASGGAARVLLNSDQDLKDLIISYQNSGTQTLDLNSPAGAGSFNAVRVYAADLNAAKKSLFDAISNANVAGAADAQDGIVDSALHSGSGVGIAAIDDHLLIRPTRIGDINLDGSVSIADFLQLAGNFGAVGTATWQEGDLNYDHNVSIADFLALAGNFGSSYTGSAAAVGAADYQTLANFAMSIGADPAVIGSAVPEPASLGMLLVGAVGLMRRRTRRSCAR